MPTVAIHGVYPIDAPQPCYIVELTIRDCESELQFSQVLFDANVPPCGVRTQAPFEEQFLSPDGSTILGNSRYGWTNPEVWQGDCRLVFLMHYLVVGDSLRTPFGNVPIPDFTDKPDRLRDVVYVSPY